MKAQGIWIKSNGEIITVEPKNGKDFKYEELREFVNGSIETVILKNNEIMIVNEEGKLNQLDINADATNVYIQSYGLKDFIVGNVLLTKINNIK